MAGKNKTSELRNPRYEVFILLLSLLSIVNVFIMILPNMNEVVEDVIEIVDFFTALIFLVDFIYRFFTTDSKRDYFIRRWGWADLLSGIPIPYFRVFRIFRIMRVTGLVRAYGIKNFMVELRSNRPEIVLALVAFLVTVVLEFGGAGIVFAEAGHPEANIQTGGDGIWWTFVSITTVGYGDRVPVTPLGRAIGFFVLVLGLAVFGAFTGYVTNTFLAGRMNESDDGKPPDQTGEISDLRSLLEEQAKINQALSKKLEQIEESIEA